MTDITQIQEPDYDAILRQAVAVIDRTRAMVATAVCSAIGTAHWEIGKLLHDKKIESKHGSGVVNRLSFDLKQRYPQMGVSPRNLWDMKKFYERFCDSEPKLRQAVAVLPWGHTLTLMRKFGEDNNTILYYAQEITSNGWNRELLSSAISLKIHERKTDHRIIILGRHYLLHRQCLPMRCSEAVIIWDFLVSKTLYWKRNLKLDW